MVETEKRMIQERDRERQRETERQGRIAWDRFKNSRFKAMKGSRKPIGSAASKVHKTARNKKLCGLHDRLDIGDRPRTFHRRPHQVNDTLTWLSPDGDPPKMFCETLRDVISEAFHAETRRRPPYPVKRRVNSSCSSRQAPESNSLCAEIDMNFSTNQIRLQELYQKLQLEVTSNLFRADIRNFIR